MKTIQKLKNIAVFALIAISAQSAWPHTTLINCVASNGQLLSFQWDTDPDEFGHSIRHGLATDLHSPNAAIHNSPVEIFIQVITTRIDYGWIYNFTLPSGTLVSVKTEVYTEAGTLDGTRGTAILEPGGTILKLKCEKSLQPSAPANPHPDENESCPPGMHWDAIHHRVPTCV